MRIRVLIITALLSTGALPGSAFAQDNVYFGNLHAHTVYSDGSGTPDEAYRMARDADLDFLAVSEHSHKAAEGSGDTRKLHIARDARLYNGPQNSSLIRAAARRTVPGEFVAIYGQEFSTISKGNHVNVFEVPDVIDVPNTRFKELVAWTQTHLDSTGRPALLQFNHPALDDDDHLEYGRDDFGGDAAWLKAMDAQAELIEVFNGPAKARTGGNRSAAVQETDYFRYLNLGFHLAPSVGQDNHYKTWGIVTDARVAVIAPELTKPAVLEALRARHAYATADKNLRIVFRAGTALQGDIVTALPTLDDDLPLTLSVVDDDEPAARYRIDVFTDVAGGDPIDGRQPANSFTLTGNTTAPMNLDGVPFSSPGQYVLVRVKQLRTDPEDEAQFEDIAWTAPIWFDNTGVELIAPLDLAAAVPAQVRLVRVLPNPGGADLRNEKIWLRNDTGASVALAGWTLTDLSGNAWQLSGVLAAGEERVFVRNGEPLSLNNDGDRLELREPGGALVQTATYGPASRNVEVSITQ